MARKLRYAVVGLGDIAQEAVLPAFKNCKRAELAALVSGDSRKLKELGRRYRVKNLFSYRQYEDCLRSSLIDAVYIALPNHLHLEYTERAAAHGIHVLCEKPLAVRAVDANRMRETCERNQVQLMTAYRLHFEPANLSAIDMATDPKLLGEPRIFQSIHSMAVRERNIRTNPVSEGGGPTYDIGIYDINAARYLFRDEPISVFAQSANSGKPAFQNIEESMAIILKFPKERLASILISFGAVDTDTFRIAGTKGELQLNPAYTYSSPKTITYSNGSKSRTKTFKALDEFAPELDAFANSVLKGKPIEPSGLEGWIDVAIIEAIHESAHTGRIIPLDLHKGALRPTGSQRLRRSAITPPGLFNAESPSEDQAA